MTKKFLILIILSLFISTTAFAQSVKQFQRQSMLNGKLPATILLIGYEKDSADAEKLLDIVMKKANETFANLDPQNPSGNVGKINAAQANEAITVSDETASAFEAAKKISEWTSGAFDVASRGEGSFKDIKISSSSVTLKKAGMKIDFGAVAEGFVAEMMIRLIERAGMKNAIVKVGNTFRGMGAGLNGPWKIEVQDDSGTFAHHALNLTVNNTGVATISASTARISPPPCKGTVVVMNDATYAAGIASAAFALGPNEGMKLIQKFGRGIIVDNGGKFLRSPGF